MRTSNVMVNRFVNGFNAGVGRLYRSRLFGGAVRRHLTYVTYTGRRSGREFSIPVGYRRTGDVVTIAIEMAEQKNWWRNFTGEGGPIRVRLDGVDRPGHAVAERNGRRRARVTVRLDGPGAPAAG